MSRNTEATDDVKTWSDGPLNYKEGFFTRLKTDELAKGINEEVVRAISARRNEPEWMLEFRLKAYHARLEMEEPHWLKAHYEKLNYRDYSYYSAPSCGNCDDTCASEPRGAANRPRRLPDSGSRRGFQPAGRTGTRRARSRG